MIVAKYKIYYDYTEPTKSDPLREEKPDNIVQRNLDYFCKDLCRALKGKDQDNSVVLESKDLENNSIVVNIKTSVPSDEYYRILKNVMNHLDLFGSKIDFKENIN